MERRVLPPAEGEGSGRSVQPFEDVSKGRIHDGFPWDQYLVGPDDPERLGICCSGGGVRSASYNLGALQVLRKEKILAEARYLSAVSGGAYIAIAHAITVDRTLAQGPADLSPGDPPAPPLDGREEFFFAGLAPWAPGSPEEQHFRDNTSYLAPGASGKVWLGMNLVYGMIRHLLPFIAGLYIVAALAGFGLARWIGPSIRERGPGTRRPDPVDLGPMVRIALVCAGLGLLGMLLRQIVQGRSHPSAATLARLQSTIFLTATTALAVVVVLVGIPALLQWLSTRPFNIPPPPQSIALYGLTSGTLLGILAVVANVLQRHVGRFLLPLVAFLIGPLVVAIPFVGFTYWTTLRGFHWGHAPATAFCAAIGLLVLYALALDEVTPNTHLFYRERLAKAFVTFRKKSGPERFRAAEPSWSDKIRLSKLQTARSVPDAKLPELLVCAAVNLSRDLPPGRGAAPFTFESDVSGSPVTGYMLTRNLEQATAGGGLTLPGMMAISGAALAPSMGKMTRPWLRMLMALMNVRLGVWLPNPRKHEAWTTSDVRRLRAGVPNDIPDAPRVPRRPARPGLRYVLREALGQNTLERSFVYVTDGGHWDNLGLVELLRRGCRRIICFDAAGDDLEHFHTLSEAIALARSDLGVEIDIDPTPLVPDSTGISPRDHVRGTFTYPDGKEGVLLFAKAAISHDAPLDVQTYREVDLRFPTDPTSDQLFNDARFEAYRSLGRHAAEGVSSMYRALPNP